MQADKYLGNNEQVKYILDSMFEEVVLIDSQYNIVDANDTFCRNNSLKTSEIKGSKCYKVTHGLDEVCNSQHCKCPVEQVFETGKPSKALHIHKSKKRNVSVELNAYPVKGLKSDVQYVVKIGRYKTDDISIKNENFETNEFLNNFLSNIINPIVIISNNHKILYMNKEAEEIFGKNHTGHICYQILKCDNKPCNQCLCDNDFINQEQKMHFKSTFEDFINKKKLHLEFNCAPIKSYNGHPAVINVIKNITEKKKEEQFLKDTEERYKVFLDNFPYPLFLLESDGHIYDYNSSVELYLNLPQDDILNKNFFELIKSPKERNEELKEMLYYVHEFDLNEIIELKVKNNINDFAWLEAFFSSIIFGEKKFIQVILQDVTERKLVDNIIKEENERLRKINEVKQQLTDETSEELKSPLNEMFDASQILLDSYKDKLDKNAIKLLKLIKRGGETSLDLVGRIVDISRFESDSFKLSKQTESLIVILEDSIQELLSEEFYPNQHFELDLNEDLYSDLDKLRIKQVINDIIVNMIRNSSKDCSINVSLKKNENYAEIYLICENKGLVDANSSFNQESEELLYGLYYSKEIIELHGGQILTHQDEKTKNPNYIIRLPIKNWKDSLIQIYILCKSGIPLYDHRFNDAFNANDSTFISGGIIGIMTIMKEIVQGDNEIKIIDHGDRKLLVETNVTKEVIFALLVTENFNIFLTKLKAFIDDFDKTYESLINTLEESCTEYKNWKDTDKLIMKYFTN